MTKEEQIWDEYMGIGDFNSLSTHNKSLIKGILSTYAKQQAIAFANHIAYNDIKPNDIDTWNGGKHNTHELYDDFLQHQFIEQQNKP